MSALQELAINESSLLWFNYLLTVNGERDAYGDRTFSQGGLAEVQADFSPPLKPPPGETIQFPLVHLFSPDSELSPIPPNYKDVRQGLFLLLFFLS